MKNKALIAGIVVLALVLVAGLGFIVYKSMAPAAPLDETPQTQSTEETPPPTSEDPQPETEEPTENMPQDAEDTTPVIVTDEENNEWASLPTSDTYPDIPEDTTAPAATTQPTEEPKETTAPTGVNGEELPGLGENDTPWN